MRLMLGANGNPSLLVAVADDYNPSNFKFTVINGCWDGVFTDGHVTVKGCPGGDFTDLGITEILTDNQDRLRCTNHDGEYNTVFNNFNNPNYVAPQYKQVKFVDMDDDIPF
jgi:hypothetical protein